jgi:hypothetical protein
LLAGCAAPRTGRTLDAKLAGSDPDAQMEFWHSMTDRALTTNDEALHGLLLYVDQRDDAQNYDTRVASLKSRGILPQGFTAPADAAVTRGDLAVAICNALRIRGGLTMHVFGATPRYATRELMFLGLYPPSTPNQTFTGNEYVGIIGRVEDWLRGNPANVPAAVLPSEMGTPSR